MKKLFLASFFLCALFVKPVFAQDEVTNDELYKYAVVQETLALFQTEISAQVKEYIESQPSEIKNRYNELAGGEAPANDAEKTFIDAVNNMKSERTSEFTEAYRTLIKRLLGSEAYNEVKGAVKSDSDVKQRYDTLVQAMRAAKDEASVSAGQ
ncbi:hypothetical protein [Tunicatimonas pelagia]|uniref:hypothetical protein n=1 Tax=Tunicatimonas pelagia TaxID=931531 RepID=UPI0026664FCA|nr:hypothetical protein [Tunicatimonas pelagia]WKN43823.1 hypothetical protein P0M28_02410 [Tunicatimonas pelagia]